MPDGSPHVSPVWFEYAGDHVRVNSAAGRQKDRNMRRDPRVALSIDDPPRSGRELQSRRTFEVTANDRRFLRSLRIAADETAEPVE